jgi:hypothetical protein
MWSGNVVRAPRKTVQAWSLEVSRPRDGNDDIRNCSSGLWLDAGRATPASFFYCQQPWEEFQVSKSWDEMTDQDQSDDINRSMEHLAKYCPEVCGSMPSAKGAAAMTVEIINATLSQSLATDECTKLAFARIKARGCTGAEAFDLMGKGIFRCLQEDLLQMPDRWPAVMEALAAGRTLDELFPSSLYHRGGTAN